jgi:peptidoglycan/xylan/chitin deacetylase (PgdA/CDA1 family)
VNTRRVYYTLKPIIPRGIQLTLRRAWTSRKRSSTAHIWPIDGDAGEPPEKWTGWPGQKRFALVLTHDVDTGKGQKNCKDLVNQEKRLGFRSSFNFVPERYAVSPRLRRDLAEQGFEVGVHGLNHDGNLYKSRAVFSQRSKQINDYLQDWEAVGFRSPAMHHNLEWLQELNIEYDASTFDTDPFEPNPEGVGTIYPFWVSGKSTRGGFVELPYTLPQDFTLYVLMQERTIDIWKQKLDWIAEKGGMALLNTHPDYMRFRGQPLGPEEYPAEFYADFLKYAQEKYEGAYWDALPREVARFWVDRFMNR